MKVTPIKSTGRCLITAFGAGGFRFGLPSGDLRIEGGVLVLADIPEPWPVQSMSALAPSSLDQVVALAGKVKFLLMGTGDRLIALPPFLRSHLNDHGVGLEIMDTAAACRAYNHLASEGRHFVAALLPVGTAPA